MRNLAAAAVALALFAARAIAESPDNEPHEQHQIATSGDLVQVAVPLAGFALTFLLRDPASAKDGGGVGSAERSGGPGFDAESLHMGGSPRHDFALAGLRTELTTFSLKYAVDEQRPNGGLHSFPSGHTAAAFMGAEFIRKEYGWWWGLPAYAAAGFVGWTRIETGNHWPHDVYAGAAIGILSNHEATDLKVPFGTLSWSPRLFTVDRRAASRFGPDTAAPDLATGLSFKLTLK